MSNEFADAVRNRATHRKLTKTISRRTVHPGISMWGSLYVDEASALAGWVVDSWTGYGVSAADSLLPKFHWVERDGKFHRMELKLGGIEIFEEERDVEPRRAVFVRATLAQWEQEYIGEQMEHR